MIRYGVTVCVTPWYVPINGIQSPTETQIVQLYKLERWKTRITPPPPPPKKKKQTNKNKNNNQKQTKH